MIAVEVPPLISVVSSYPFFAQFRVAQCLKLKRLIVCESAVQNSVRRRVVQDFLG